MDSRSAHLRDAAPIQPGRYHDGLVSRSGPPHAAPERLQQHVAIVGLVQAGAGIGILPLRLVEASIAAGTLRHLQLPGAIAGQAIFVAYSKGALDLALPEALELVRQAMRDQRFCE